MMPVITKMLHLAATKSIPEITKWLVDHKDEHVIQMTFVDERSNFLIDYDSRRAMLLNCETMSKNSKLDKIFREGARVMLRQGEPDYEWIAKWTNELACAYCEEFVLPYAPSIERFLTAYWPSSNAENEYDSCRILARIPSLPTDTEIDVAVCQVPLDSGVSKGCMARMMGFVKDGELLCISSESENAACEGFVGCRSAEKYGFDHTAVKQFLSYIMSDTERESETGRYMLVQSVNDDYVRTRISIQYDEN